MTVVSLPNRPVLNGAEQSVFDKYTSKNLLNEAKCELEYIQSNPKFKTDILINAGEGALQGGIIGLGVGLVVCALAEKYFKVLSKPSKDKTTALCMFGGAALMSAINFKQSYLEISRSREFVEWKIEAIKQNVYPLFMDFIERDNAPNGLSTLVCPISHGLITQPTKTPAGHTYEMASIIQWINNNGGHTLCPLRACMVTVASLNPDPTYHKTVVTRMRQILLLDIDSNVRRGIEAYISNVKYERDQMAFHEIDVLRATRPPGMTPADFIARCDIIKDRYSL